MGWVLHAGEIAKKCDFDFGFRPAKPSEPAARAESLFFRSDIHFPAYFEEHESFQLLLNCEEYSKQKLAKIAPPHFVFYFEL